MKSKALTLGGDWKRLIGAADINQRVREVGARIGRDYAGEEVVLVGLLQGGLFFLCDLARHTPLPLRLDTMWPRSYGGGLASSGTIQLVQDLGGEIEDQHVIVVDDIYDSGRTLHYVCERLRQRRPKSLAVACALVKDAPRACEVAIRYSLFDIPTAFVVGYGLDLAGLGRNLPEIWALRAGVSEQSALAQLRTQLGGGGELVGGQAE